MTSKKMTKIIVTVSDGGNKLILKALTQKEAKDVKKVFKTWYGQVDGTKVGVLEAENVQFVIK